MPQVKPSPGATWVNLRLTPCTVNPTGVGVGRPIAVPSPSWLLLFRPAQKATLSPRTVQAWKLPTSPLRLASSAASVPPGPTGVRKADAEVPP
jgi:hypothetical protein